MIFSAEATLNIRLGKTESEKLHVPLSRIYNLLYLPSWLQICSTILIFAF